MTIFVSSIFFEAPCIDQRFAEPKINCSEFYRQECTNDKNKISGWYSSVYVGGSA